jgi:Ca-activated chloride channel family protein
MTILSHMFEFPALLWHLALVVVIGGVWIASKGRRRLVLADWPGVRRVSESIRRRDGFWMTLRLMGLGCLVVALAGPFAGDMEMSRQFAGRDLMIALDLSRSMNAEQPSRLERALRVLRTIADDRRRLPAGTRVGLVVFAAEPMLVFPFTRDFDHLRAKLDEFVAGDRPVEVRGTAETFVSGTRLGAALSLALESIPQATPGRAEILVVSDGDDPEADDEWKLGLNAARTRGVAVSTVAVGNPDAAATIPYRDDVLRHDGKIVTSAVDRTRLAEIAEQTGGTAYTVDRGDLPLAALIARKWERSPLPAELTDAEIASRRVLRWPWVLVALVILLADFSRSWPKRLATFPRRAAVAFVLGVVALAAGPHVAEGMAELLRGQTAFERQDFTAAIEHFDRAMPYLDDPGLAAFNRAAAYYRLKRYAAAADDYRRSLDDSGIPVERKQRALYDLGNSFLQQAGTSDAKLLEQAAEAYKQCLAEAPPESLRSNAEHNLQIAARRLAELSQSDPPQGQDPEGPKKLGPAKNGKNSGPSNKEKTTPTQETPKDGVKDATDPSPTNSNGKNAGIGRITVLPERASALVELIAEARRIANERRRDRQPPAGGPLNGKDW